MCAGTGSSRFLFADFNAPLIIGIAALISIFPVCAHRLARQVRSIRLLNK